MLAAEKKAAADKAKAEKAEAKLIREREKLDAQKKAYEAAQAKAREQSEKAKESANAVGGGNVNSPTSSPTPEQSNRAREHTTKARKNQDGRDTINA